MPVIDMDLVRRILGKKFRPDGDYLVCRNDQNAHACDSKGYKRVGTIYHEGEGTELVIFDRSARRHYQDDRPGFFTRFLGGFR